MTHLKGTMITQRQIQDLRDGLLPQGDRMDSNLPVVLPKSPAAGATDQLGR